MSCDEISWAGPASFQYSNCCRNYWGLRFIAMHGEIKKLHGLKRLLHVEDERRCRELHLHHLARGRVDCVTDTLAQCLAQCSPLHLVWCAEFLSGARKILSTWVNTMEKVCMSEEARRALSPVSCYYRLLYNVCLWQRRHPLLILTPILDVFGHILPSEAIDDILEGLSHHLIPELRDVPHLLRCDVLMTYPRLSFEQQWQLMDALRPSYSVDTAGSVGGSDGNEAPPPSFFVGGHVREVQPRFGSCDITAEQYTKLRRAFELHKQDGIRRIISRVP
uniref:Uncharacterized protein n=1 Tax=Trypanosoma congolense (strain IL3000) TaxID=1068625 RepID=G0US48_TRYCI|nr:conserved hypothetical protein [Trypanosoma congolense IL3000]